ncbi:MAG: hypothetical protein IJ736_02120 [Firmicutes bacterium]|nr:hypothetical protein [Bacillota bacterium]
MLEDFFRKMFGGYKKHTLINFLEKADNAYIKAFQYRMLGDFADYALPDVYYDIQQRIIYRNNHVWGTENLRKRKWDIVSQIKDKTVVRKELIFENVKFGNTFVPLGDKCIEYWTVIRTDAGYKIKEIQNNG